MNTRKPVVVMPWNSHVKRESVLRKLWQELERVKQAQEDLRRAEEGLLNDIRRLG